MVRVANISFEEWEAGSWVTEAGRGKQEVGSWVTDAGSYVQEDGSDIRVIFGLAVTNNMQT